MPQVQVLIGPARSGKTDTLLGYYRRALARGAAGCGLWLSPTQRGAEEIRNALLGPELPACLAPGITTFARFAEAVVRASEHPIEPIGGVEQRALIDWVIGQAHQQQRLRYFTPLVGTAGLVDLVAGFIRELKRVEVWPDDFEAACRRRARLGPRAPLAPKDHDVLLVYRGYQQQLETHGLYDAEGRFWWARQLLVRGQQPPLERLTTVVVDGFTDFIRTQHEILIELARRADALYIALPGEESSQRGELFQKSMATLRRLEEGLAQAKLPPPRVQFFQRLSPPRWPAMEHLERNLFCNPRDVQPAASSQRIEILPAASPRDELLAIGRRIKRLLVEGDSPAGTPVQPAEIVVVLRGLSAMAPLVREVFQELGIPFALEAGEPVSHSPAVAALVQLLQLLVEDWPYRSLLAVLGSSYLMPDWHEWQGPQMAARVRGLVRSLQVPQGRQALVGQIERLIATADMAAAQRQSADPEDPTEPAPSQRHQQRLQQLAQRVGPAVLRLADRLARLPQEATVGQWVDEFLALTEELGFQRVLNRRVVTRRIMPRDQAAWRRLFDSLAACDRLPARLGIEPQRYDVSQFAKLVRYVATHESLPCEHDETGRVRVLSAATARSVSAAYLFLAGLSEKAFPAPPPSAQLYAENELAQLQAAELPLVLRAEQSSDEMLLFYEVVTHATHQLVLSFPALDPRAQPMLPSPYLEEVQRICGIDPESLNPPDPRPVPDTAACSLVDARLRAVAELHDHAEAALTAWLASDDRATAAHVAHAVAVVQQRGFTEFGPYEGMLLGDAALAVLRRKFGAERSWSPSHLELYGTCPFRFFAEKTLRLEPLEELSLETDYASRGTTVHDLLAAVHERINTHFGRPTALHEVDTAVWLRLLDEVFADQQRGDQDLDPVSRALRAIDRRLARDWLADYADQHNKYLKQTPDCTAALAPAHFEVSFGIDPPSPDPLSSVDPLVIAVGGQPVRFRGRIDRIDTGQLDGGPRLFSVIDYKSGSDSGYTDAAISGGELLQLPLYAQAAMQLLARQAPDAPLLPVLATYWFLKGSGPKNMQGGLSDAGGTLGINDAWQQWMRDVAARIERLLAALRLGQFPVYNPNERCTSSCQFSTICRINQIRALEKTWQP